MKLRNGVLLTAISMVLANGVSLGQDAAAGPDSEQRQLTESGHTMVAGHSLPYLIRRLPVSSFPELPTAISDFLEARRCMIPQTYQAHHPENVIHASLERAGSKDWAVLCSANGMVTLLVFFASAPQEPMTLGSTPETVNLESHDPSGVLGFDWGIDPASPKQVREAQAAMEHHPPLLDHDALADTIVEKSTVYHFYSKKAWALIETTD